MALLINVGTIFGIGVLGIILVVACIAAVEYRKSHYVCGQRGEWVTFEDGWTAFLLDRWTLFLVRTDYEYLWLALDSHGYSVYGLGQDEDEYLIEDYWYFLKHVEGCYQMCVKQEN